jgi:hypothetical protein
MRQILGNFGGAVELVRRLVNAIESIAKESPQKRAIVAISEEKFD